MIGKSSRNADRKLAYARMAAEQDKEARNRDLSNALGEGAANVEAKGAWVTHTREEILAGPNGKERRVKIREREMTAKALIMPSLPQSAGRSAKRARLKASRKARLVSNTSHPNGACGNVGCRSCNPAQNPRRPRFAKDGSILR